MNRSHNLRAQLPDLKRLAIQHNLNLSPNLETLINVWNDDDPHGMRGRYPYTRDGKRDELANGDSFDLLHFVHACEAALDELNSMLEQIVFAGSHSDFVKVQVNEPANTEPFPRTDRPAV